ncbi:MAG: phospho-N-acetylmuramoyl-pentapeptide-transferase [Armatimonadota bacterium]|nr:phospho-N-acetylmuramoyl-pentapeptide-transferase [Armatimonadota bacterium]MDR5702823.1 phospho-N-acetylmuramoyl-pentapeptide-transferase [Armatimonadota bacterium]
MRVAAAGVLAALAVLAGGPWVIAWFKRLGYRQQIREDAPTRHRSKAGTPTMGGLLIVGATLFAMLVAGSLAGGSFALALVALSLLVFGGIGAVDDLLAIRRGRNLGLRARERLAIQIPFALLIGFLVMRRFGAEVFLPLLRVRWDLGWAYPAFAFFYLLGFTNATNLTDGLDGLASGVAALASGAYIVIAWRMGDPQVAVASAALTGACVAFLWYNKFPAQVFMGDVGSNAIGAALATIAMVTKTELLLVIVGGVFVAEALSVILQVAYFKATGGKRIFRMSPLHHHFELGGLAEPQVVRRFWGAGALLALIGVAMTGS